MARRSLTLARAVQLASKAVKNDDTAVEPLIELFAGMTDRSGDARYQAMRTAVLQTWYCQTEDFRNHFREFVGEVENEDEDLSRTTIESTAPAS